MSVPYLTSALLQDIPYIRHGFFGRLGGVSQGHFNSLNTGLEKGDIDQHVLENRERIASQFELNKENFVLLKQKHTDIVYKIPDIEAFSDSAPVGDALVTNSPNFLLGIQTADCVPILFADMTQPIVGAAHAGWRGAVGGVIESTLKAMRDLGSKNENIVSALGPCIWQDSYEVTAEFLENLKDTPQFFKPGRDQEHFQFNLPGYVEYRLKKAGIINISPSPIDTYGNVDRFFSFRRKTKNNEGNFGNQVSVICIRA